MTIGFWDEPDPAGPGTVRDVRDRHEITSALYGAIMVSSCEDEWRRCNPEAVRSSPSLP